MISIHLQKDLPYQMASNYSTLLSLEGSLLLDTHKQQVAAFMRRLEENRLKTNLLARPLPLMYESIADHGLNEV